MPIDNGMNAHKLRPTSIRRVEESQVLAVRVGAAGADEDGADVGCVVQVVGEGFAHGLCVA